MFKKSFPAVGDLQSFGRLVFIIVLVGSLLLLAICLGNGTTWSGMIAVPRGQLWRYG